MCFLYKYGSERFLAVQQTKLKSATTSFPSCFGAYPCCSMPVHFSHHLGRSDAVRLAKFANNSGIYGRIAR
jgi:hypothetical protein